MTISRNGLRVFALDYIEGRLDALSEVLETLGEARASALGQALEAQVLLDGLIAKVMELKKKANEP